MGYIVSSRSGIHKILYGKKKDSVEVTFCLEDRFYYYISKNQKSFIASPSLCPRLRADIVPAF